MSSATRSEHLTVKEWLRLNVLLAMSKLDLCAVAAIKQPDKISVSFDKLLPNRHALYYTAHAT